MKSPSPRRAGFPEDLNRAALERLRALVAEDAELEDAWRMAALGLCAGRIPMDATCLDELVKESEVASSDSSER